MRLSPRTAPLVVLASALVAACSSDTAGPADAGPPAVAPADAATAPEAAAPVTGPPLGPSCANGARDGAEVDVDCGGPL
ncbi:MAG TPA: hypothetical protein PLR99_20265, partial [Polyangiaceae bacterium]|nr:hypothetical protein [Polyangiaceae bacterium]